MARGLGQGLREFRKSVREASGDLETGEPGTLHADSDARPERA
jgi:Sec-independent protein translocase protein TatA